MCLKQNPNYFFSSIKQVNMPLLYFFHKSILSLKRLLVLVNVLISLLKLLFINHINHYYYITFLNSHNISFFFSFWIFFFFFLWLIFYLYIYIYIYIFFFFFFYFTLFLYTSKNVPKPYFLKLITLTFICNNSKSQ